MARSLQDGIKHGCAFKTSVFFQERVKDDNADRALYAIAFSVLDMGVIYL